MRWLAVLWLLGATPAWAHGMRTAHVSVTEVSPGHAVAVLQLSAPDPALALASADACAVEPAGSAVLARSWRIACPGALAGHQVALLGLGPLTSEVAVTIERVDGTTTTAVVFPDAPTFALAPAATSASAVAEQFVGLGFVHIATGYDHLLFLLMLALLLREPRSVILAESAFTLSHSLSFSATALGWIAVSAAAAEACIALSLVLLAAELDAAAPRPPRWRGAALAFAFGLVHGLGFAGGLREIGLPDHAITSALVGFAGGVELGQIAFLALVLGALRLLRDVRGRPAGERIAIYAMGGFSAYLLIARVLALTA